MIDRARSDDVRLPDFAPVLVANSLPFTGIVLPNTAFSVQTVLLLYWFEMLSLFLVYCGCALFAQQEPTTDENEDEGEDGMLSNVPSVRFHRSLPAVHLRNLQVIVVAALIVGGFVTGIVDEVISSHNAYGSFPSWLSEFTAPAMFGPALAIVAAHLIYVYRDYFRPHRYREMSPQTVLDGPIRLLLLFSLMIFAWFFIFAFTGFFMLEAEAFSRPAAEFIAQIVLFGGFFLLKVGIEWIRFRAKHAAEPSGLAALLVPQEQRSTSQD